jgi:excisionase family DNA binding protein
VGWAEYGRRRQSGEVGLRPLLKPSGEVGLRPLLKPSGEVGLRPLLNTGGAVDSARDLPAVLDTAGAAQLLGVNIDKMRQMARDGQVPAHLLPGGRMYRFLTDELLDWLRDQPSTVRDRVEAAEG